MKIPARVVCAFYAYPCNPHLSSPVSLAAGCTKHLHTMTKKEELEAQGYKTYENEDIRVFWKPRICQHAGECARGNFNVFNPQRRSG